jgi:hypothetical protein
MLNNIRDLGLDISINNILYGNADFTYVNCSLFAAVHKYILDTKRNVYILLAHLTATTQHRSQYILLYYVIFLK